MHWLTQDLRIVNFRWNQVSLWQQYFKRNLLLNLYREGKSHGRRAWWAVVHGVAKSRTGLSDFTFTFTFHFHALEKEMATHSSVLAWRIPGTGESMGLHRVGHDWSDLAAAAAWNSLDCFMLLFSLLVSSSLSFAWGHQISHFILMIIVIFLGANTHPPHGPPSLFLPPYRKLLLGLNVCTFFNTSTKFTKHYAGYGSYHLQSRKN